MIGADRDNMLQAVMALSREVLGRQDVGPDDDFFGLGGDSLSLADLLVRLEALTGRRFEPSLIYESGSVRALAARLSDAGVVCRSPNGNGTHQEPERSLDTEWPMPPQYREFMDRELWAPEEENCRIVSRLSDTADWPLIRRAMGEAAQWQEALRLSVKVRGAEARLCLCESADETVEFLEVTLARRPSHDPIQLFAEFEELMGRMDPLRDRLVRVGLLTVGRERWLLLKLSHLIVDHGSVPTLLEQMEQTYLGQMQGREAMGATRIPEFLSASVAAEGAARDYWRQRLSDRSRDFFGGIENRQGERIDVPMTTLIAEEPCSAKALQDLCEMSAVPELPVLFTLYTLALAPFCHRPHVAISSTVSGRSRVLHSGVIGYMSANLLYPFDLSLERPLVELLRENAATLSGGRQNMFAARGELNRMAGRTDFLNFTVTPRPQLADPFRSRLFLDHVVLETPTVGIAYDLTTRATLLPEHVRMRYNFCASRVPRSVVTRVAANFSALMRKAQKLSRKDLESGSAAEYLRNAVGE